MSYVIEIFLKEIRELARDRKTLISVVLFPTVLLPLIVVAFSMFAGLLVGSAKAKPQKLDLSYAIVGKNEAPTLSKFLLGVPGLREVAINGKDEIAAAISSEKVQFVLFVPAGFEQNQELMKQGTLVFHRSELKVGDLVQSQFEPVLESYNANVRQTLFGKLGLNGDLLAFAGKPVALEVKNVANLSDNSSRQLGEQFGAGIALVLLSVCFIGSMYPAERLGVGEKERGTLETLLLMPVSRVRIVFGKFLVLLSSGVLLAALELVSLSILINFGAALLGKSMSVWAAFSAVRLLDVLLVFLMLLSVAAIFSAVLLCTSLYAKNSKEMQSYVAPVIVAIGMAGMVGGIPTLEFEWYLALVPIINFTLAVKCVLIGSAEWLNIILMMLSNFIIAAGLLYCCGWYLERESVLLKN